MILHKIVICINWNIKAIYLASVTLESTILLRNYYSSLKIIF